MNSAGSCSAREIAFSRRDFDRVDNNLIEQLLEVFGQDEAAPPENLAVVLPPGKAIGVMRCNLANSRTYSEGYFHHLVECGLVPSGAESAAVPIAVYELERSAGVEDAAASGTQNVPREIEEAKPRRVEESCDQVLLVKTSF